MKLYLESYRAEEACNLGCLHDVTYNQVIEVEEIESRKREVFYGDSSCGFGFDRWYADSDGTIYYRETTWDGPGNYMFDDSGDQTKFYGVMPHGHEVNKDLDGNLIERYPGAIKR